MPNLRAELPAFQSYPTVLAVDDEQSNLDLISRALRRDYRLLLAETAEAGLEILRNEDVDVILTDQRLPGMSGVELLAQAVRCAPSVRRVILTAYADMDVVIDAINQGHVHHFVKKPWDPSELAVVLSTVIEFGRLESENNRLVAELRSTNEELTQNHRILAASLDERGKELLGAIRELETVNRELSVRAYRDGLTTLYNHRTFQERLKEELARARRYHKPLGLIFGDLDHFKAYNDALGHVRGDEALRMAARVLNGGIPGTPPARESDIVARYGGEEFVVLLPETDKEGARVRAERLRQAIADTRFPQAEETPIGRITISFGVAAFPDDARTADDLLVAADHALYVAKRRGRNLVHGAGEPDGPAQGASEPPPPGAHGGTGTADSAALGGMPEPVRRPDSMRPAAVPSLSDRGPDIEALLVRAGALSCFYIDFTGLRRIETELGSATFAEVMADAQLLLRDPRRLRSRPGDLLCRAEGGEAYLVFFSDTRDRRMAREELDAAADRLAAWLDHGLTPRVQALLHERAQIHVGRARVLHNPLVRGERLISQVVEEARESAAFERQLRRSREKRSLQDLILSADRDQAGGLTSVYQPIVHFASASIFGYEALARGPRRTALELPQSLFAAAESTGLLFELDRACFRTALRSARGISPTHRLFVNLLPLSVYDETFIGRDIERLIAEAGLTPANVVFEITERLAIENFASFRRALGRATARGFGVAIDDVGTRHANLEAVIALRPNFIKLSDAICRGLARSGAKRGMIRSLASFAETIDAVLVAEGIEGPHDLAALVEAGVRYGQGYFLARPSPPWVELRPATARALHAFAVRQAQDGAGAAPGDPPKRRRSPPDR